MFLLKLAWCKTKEELGKGDHILFGQKAPTGVSQKGTRVFKRLFFTTVNLIPSHKWKAHNTFSLSYRYAWKVLYCLLL